MSISGGMFNIIWQQAQFSAAAVRYQATSVANTASAGGSTNPLTWSLKKSESAIQAYWRLAPEGAAKNAPSIDIVKRLEKAAEGDNKEISAEKLRQAKAKLAALRQQLQLAAVSGDPGQIKRLAAEAARLAREIGSAARHLMQGSVAALAGTNGEGGAEAATPAGMAEAAGMRDAVLQSIHAIGSDARDALAAAKGIIVLAAQTARSRRKDSGDDDDSFFRRLQVMVDEALAEVDAGQRAALGRVFLPVDDAGILSATAVSIEVTATIQSATVVLEIA